MAKRTPSKSETVVALNTALAKKEGNTAAAFLLAFRQVAETYGIAQLAEEAKLSRESLYRTLSEKGNPRLSTVVALLDVLGLTLKIEQQPGATEEEQPQPDITTPPETLPLSSFRFTSHTPPKSNVIKVTLWLTVERNSKFVRGKKHAREDIEYYVLRHYDMKKRWPDGNEYELTIPYDTDEELDEIIERNILQEASSQADLRNCFIEASVRALDDSDRSW
jgi:probable addiction module antidote protein